MLWFSSDLLKASGSIKEGFQVQQRLITINMCPQWAPQIQTAKGNTDCCEGELLDGKCSAKTFCTLSAPHDGVSSCIDAWKQYFAEKRKQCPSTMPNYFENVKVRNSIKGCSASTIKEDGSVPQNSSAKRCRVYDTEKENREKIDSCFVQKERLKIQCPSFPGYTSRVDTVWGSRNTFGFFNCSYSNSLGQTTSCADEKTLTAMWDRENANWRMNKTKYTQLENISCRTFVSREQIKERERQRVEVERRKREEAERRLQQQKSWWENWRKRWESQADRARRQNEEQRRKQQAEIDELRNRLKNCKK